MKYEIDSEPLSLSLLLRGKHREKKSQTQIKRELIVDNLKEALISQMETL